MAFCGVKCWECKRFNIECSGCSMCEAPIVCNRKCANCIYSCCKRAGIALYYESISSQEKTSQKEKNIDFKIPKYIPTVPSPLRITYNADELSMLAVHAGKFFTDSGKDIARVYLQKGVYSALNINPKTKICLHFYTPDKTLEGFWQNRSDIYTKLKTFGFDFIISPNFSVYEDSPRYEHLLNISRTMKVYDDFMANGINSIPDVSWFNVDDLNKWVLLIDELKLKTIAFSFQAVGEKKRSNVWKTYLLGLRYLCEKIDQDIGFIIVGVNSVTKLKEISRVTKNRKVSIINTFAFMKARCGFKYNERKISDMNFDDLFIFNVKNISSQIQEIF